MRGGIGVACVMGEIEYFVPAGQWFCSVLNDVMLFSTRWYLQPVLNGMASGPYRAI